MSLYVLHSKSKHQPSQKSVGALVIETNRIHFLSRANRLHRKCRTNMKLKGGRQRTEVQQCNIHLSICQFAQLFARCLGLGILVISLVNFLLVNWLLPLMQGKLTQGTHKYSPTMSPTPPNLVRCLPARQGHHLDLERRDRKKWKLLLARRVERVVAQRE